MTHPISRQEGLAVRLHSTKMWSQNSEPLRHVFVEVRPEFAARLESFGEQYAVLRYP